MDEGPRRRTGGSNSETGIDRGQRHQGTATDPKKAARVRHLASESVAVLALSLLIAVSAGWVLFQKGAVQKNPFDTSWPRWKDESATHFTFAAAGDFGGPGNNDSLGLVGRARTAGMSFFLALGDLGYTTSASGWCTQMKRLVPEIVIIDRKSV